MSKSDKLLLVLLLSLPAVAQGALFNFGTLNETIPDGTATGLVNVQEITSEPGMNITDLNVTLNISGTGLGGFNGDLYVTLQHDSGYSVLLNRPGTRSGTTYGYSDSGLGVTFDDSASSDVHVYRLVLNGNHTTPLGSSLSGTWAPDARTQDPGSVLSSSSQTANLASFNALAMNGTWTLFVADLSEGATHRLDSWGMEATVTPVPEPRLQAALGAGALLLFAFFRKRA